MKVEIIKTKDGSHSLSVPELNETYHSTHGAVTESQYVFIEKGLQYLTSILGNEIPEEPIRVLEVGFGTGLNALLTCLCADEQKIKIEYHSLETNPIDLQVVSKLNYTEIVLEERVTDVFKALHSAPWNELYNISDCFSLRKIKEPLQSYESENDLIDLVYFDAFAPSKQPEMWTRKLLQKVYNLMSRQGVFVTYCAQGQFKRDLRSVGFEVERLEGPPGKAEMTRAIKT